MTERRLKIADITIGEQVRKDMGDLAGLARSIKKVGLLHPIGVTKNGHKLVFGERRLRAVQMNGDTEIDCRILDISDEDILTAQVAEGQWQDMHPSERRALRAAGLVEDQR